MNETHHVYMDGKTIAIEGERNLLELARKAGIFVPTFCYHSELSVYGACRLCLMDVEGRGIVSSCSTAPEPGMKVRTATPEIREMRKLTVELLLAEHNQSCTTCTKSGACQLQSLAQRLGVDRVRFRPTRPPAPVDESSPSLVRDPNKCVLCGDCVRVCAEVQGIGAIDFAYRGAQAAVLPAFGKNLAGVECVYCGQCARVCPTGALTPKPESEAVWTALADPDKVVAVQVAPAVRVALGEALGKPEGAVPMEIIAAALRRMGFDAVYDTSFAADLTVIEEAEEFMRRKTDGVNLPLFTSCCPGWVKYAEQYHPGILRRLSTCKSPQQMFGALLKDWLEKQGTPRDKAVVVSVMPCTAKKYEARLPKFRTDGVPDVDYVITTQELARMISELGFPLEGLEPAPLDRPFGDATGAGVIFGNSGGVTEAVLRYAVERIEGKPAPAIEFEAVRGEPGLREAEVTVAGTTLRLAVVHGLANAGRVAKQVEKGTCPYDLIEVMACPGGCIGGAGQPVADDALHARRARTEALFAMDRGAPRRAAQDNPAVAAWYKDRLGEPGGETAHHLLHTDYKNRRRIEHTALPLVSGKQVDRIGVNVCMGTSCHVRGSQKLLTSLMQYVEERGLEDFVDVKASFCFEQCDKGPTVTIEDTVYHRCTLQTACDAISAEVDAMAACYTAQELPGVAGTLTPDPDGAGYLTQRDFESQTAASLERFLRDVLKGQTAG